MASVWVSEKRALLAKGPAHFRARALRMDLGCVWNPRVFADDARGWQCPFEIGRASCRERV